jgi:CRISPR-associated protein Cas2
MKGFGYPLQYSVFVCDLDHQEKLAMKVVLAAVIHHAIDSIAIIDLGDPVERGVECFEFMGFAPNLPTTEPKVL